MIDFVGIPPLLRMATMHFHIAQTDLFVRNIFFAFRGSRQENDTHEKLSWRCKVGQVRCGGTGYPHFLLILELANPGGFRCA